MEPEEVADYIGHRLRIAGWQGSPDFAENAFPVLHRATGGVPRRLNQLMGRVMLHAAITDAKLIDASLVNAVRADAARDLPSAARAAPIMRAVPSSLPATPEPVVATAEAPAAPAPVDPELLDRIASLEKRIEEQDAALRRVLTLLVDWVESDAPAPRGGLEAVRGAAA
jgi:hypothetical protein